MDFSRENNWDGLRFLRQIGVLLFSLDGFEGAHQLLHSLLNRRAVADAPLHLFDQRPRGFPRLCRQLLVCKIKNTKSSIYARLDYSSKVLSASTMEGALKLPELNLTKSWE